MWCVQVVVIYKNTPSTQYMGHFTILKNPFDIFNQMFQFNDNDTHSHLQLQAFFKKNSNIFYGVQKS